MLRALIVVLAIHCVACGDDEPPVRVMRFAAAEPGALAMKIDTGLAMPPNGPLVASDGGSGLIGLDRDVAAGTSLVYAVSASGELRVLRNVPEPSVPGPSRASPDCFVAAGDGYAAGWRSGTRKVRRLVLDDYLEQTDAEYALLSGSTLEVTHRARIASSTSSSLTAATLRRGAEVEAIVVANGDGMLVHRPGSSEPRALAIDGADGVAHVASLGDVDRDGVDDLAVGIGAEIVGVSGASVGGEPRILYRSPIDAMHCGSLAAAAGRIAVGAGLVPSGPERVDVFSAVDGSLVGAVSAPPRARNFGSSVAFVDDVDGDGAPDLLVGAWRSGHAVLLSGRDFAPIRTFSEAGTVGFGTVVGQIGDVTGDGVRDFFVQGCAPDERGGAQLPAVCVWIYAGGASSER